MDKSILENFGGMIIVLILLMLFLYLYNTEKLDVEMAKIAIEHGYEQKVVNNQKIWIKRSINETNSSTIR